jgi:Family of unknown function (DUF6348)
MGTVHQERSVSTGGEHMSLDHHLVLNAIQDQLSELGIPSSIVGSQVRLDEWPTVAISLDHSEDVTDPDIGSSVRVFHLHLTLALNHERPDSAILSCATGMGRNIEEAVANAAKQWCQTTVPPVLSVLAQRPVYDAEWFAPDDPYGLPGWELFSSPYLVRGDAQTRTLVAYLEEQPLIPSVSSVLLAEMKPSTLFTTVALYRGQVGDKTYADSFIDGHLNERVTQALLDLPWPDIAGFHSVRLFLFCMPAAGRVPQDEA